jgi:hypothetical protein
MKEVIAFLIVLLPLFYLIGDFYWRISAEIYRALRPAMRAFKSAVRAGNGGHDHAGR